MRAKTFDRSIHSIDLRNLIPLIAFTALLLGVRPHGARTER